jgi:DNA-binding winged helix-turn-helix (wHTH) protein/Tol biopolymer transport system component
MSDALGTSKSSQTPFAKGIIRFGSFEADLRSGELRRAGLKVKLGGQPFDVLVTLLEKPGQVVTREELHDKLWAQDTFVDFEHGLNKAINKVREALGDDADNPRFIETLPRRGYRFLAPVGQSAPELAIDAALQPASPSPVALPDEIPDTSRENTKKLVYYGVALVGAFIVLFAAALTLWKGRSQPSGQLRVVRFVQVTNDGQPKSGPMATDGLRIYFNEILPGQIRSLAQVSISGGEVVRLPTPLGRPQLLDLTPDGLELLLANQEETGVTLWIQPLVGGSPRRIGSALVNDAAWGPHGATVVYGDRDSVYLMNQDGTDPRKLLSQPGPPHSFSFSPDGQVLRFSLRYGESSSVMETSADGTSLRELLRGCCGKWTPDGRYFIFQSEHEGRTDLWALSEAGGFSPRTATKRAIQLTAGPLEFHFPISSKDGKEIFAIGHLRRAEVVRYDSRAREFSPFFPGISAEGLSFSRDAEWVSYTSYPDGTLWRSRIDGSDRVQLTFPPMRVLLPKWSPDGRQVAFSATFPGRSWNIYLISAEGGTPKQLLPDAEDRVDVNWSLDGNSLFFGSFGGMLHGPHPISILDLRTTRISTLPGSVGLSSPRLSPDGRYICATTWDSFRLMLFDFTTQQWTQLSGPEVGYQSWSHDGRYIYFERKLGHTGSARVERIRVSDRKSETIVDLKNLGRSATGTFTEWIGLGPDDSPLLARDISTGEIYVLQLDIP